MTVLVPLRDVAAATAERVGPKAATLARLCRAGLPVPDGVVLPAEVYRAALAAAGVAAAAERVAGADEAGARRLALEVRLGLTRAPLDDLPAPTGLVAVRSSALLEDTPHACAAGQFETFLGVADVRDLVTAVRACWASLWSTRALRYLRDRGLDPAATAMAVLVQRLVPARAAGGALSRTPDGGMLLTGAWGLGASVAHGEVVPDRFRLGADGSLAGVEPGVKDRLVACEGDVGPRARPVAGALVATPCLEASEAEELGRLVRAAESILGTPVEVEWALGDAGLEILQARPLRVESLPALDAVWARGPAEAPPSPGGWGGGVGGGGRSRLTGHPSGLGRGSGRACVVRREGDLDHVGLGDVLVTRVAGPALAAVLPRVAGVVAELGGSSSHLAALARERGIPAVLGVPGATRRIPEGAQVAVDGITGVVHWTR
ncbi:MAG: pyruvate, phosphate dikinase [Candidatus Rokubacteria bacterium]|nr:pyruvate, phosphate dikinase [Candidatus Rokubacteria bacterium]